MLAGQSNWLLRNPARAGRVPRLFESGSCWWREPIKWRCVGASRGGAAFCELQRAEVQLKRGLGPLRSALFVVAMENARMHKFLMRTIVVMCWRESAAPGPGWLWAAPDAHSTEE